MKRAVKVSIRGRSRGRVMVMIVGLIASEGRGGGGSPWVAQNRRRSGRLSGFTSVRKPQGYCLESHSGRGRGFGWRVAIAWGCQRRHPKVLFQLLRRLRFSVRVSAGDEREGGEVGSMSIVRVYETLDEFSWAIMTFR